MASEKQKRRAPAFQFYADDFLAGTLDMSQQEVGIYIKLLCFQWSRGGLPNDIGRLAMLVRTNNEPNNETALRYVLDTKFVVCQDGQLRNNRMEEVRKQSENWHEKSVSGGKASGGKRLGDSEWGKQMAKQRNNKRTSNEPNNEPPHEPITNSPSPSPNINTHTHTPAEPIASNLPDWLVPAWSRLMEYFLATTGQRVDPIRAETMAMSLMRSGEAKALADIDFTILKGGKSILDSANDFEKRTKRGGDTKPKEKPIF